MKEFDSGSWNSNDKYRSSCGNGNKWYGYNNDNDDKQAKAKATFKGNVESLQGPPYILTRYEMAILTKFTGNFQNQIFTK